MRKPASSQRRKPRIAAVKNFPAPVGGWIANVGLATPSARRPDGSKVAGAFVLENGFPAATAVKMRGGSRRHAILGDGSSAVGSIFSYVFGSTRKMFAATGGAIYDVTTPARSEDLFIVDEDGNFVVNGDGEFYVWPGTPEEAVGGLNGGEWSVVQFATSGGVFLRLVNGADTSLVYDGTGFSTSPAINNVTSSTLSHVWVYKNRLFFVQKDTLDAWYLAVDTIGGDATKFPLGGVFTRGGTLLFGASWSLDADGLSAQCAFFTTEGEVAVYQGTNPGDANSWSLVGVYRIGKPRGPNAYIRAGGDLVIATDIGFIPLSQAVQRDIAALSPAAVSFPIEDAWNEAVRNRTGLTWQCEVWPTKQMVVVALPTEAGQQQQMFVANARTGAWAKYTGWGATCVEVFGERMFFGTTDSRVIEADTGGTDQGQPYEFVCVPLFDPLNSPAALKIGHSGRVVLRSNGSINARLALQRDYQISLPPSPDPTQAVSSNLWGTATWGEATWGAAESLQSIHPWQSVPGSGYALSVSCQISSSSVAAPDVELVQTDLTYETADVVS